MLKGLLPLIRITLVTLILLPFAVLAGDPPIAPGEENDKMVYAYPNPTSSVVNVRISDVNFHTLAVQIEDTKGKILLKDRITQPGVHTINMRLLSQGSYILHLQSDDGTIDQRKSIQKVNP
jgi:hypothetical protein